MERPPTRPPEVHQDCQERLARIVAEGKRLESLPHPLWARLLPFAIALGLYTSAYLASQSQGWVWLLATIGGGIFYMWIGIYGHDCTHNAYHERPGPNRWLGTWILAHGYASFEAYRALHIAHHQNTGFDTDPSGDSPAVQDQANLLGHILFVLIPTGFPIFQVIPGWLTALGIEPKPYPACVKSRIRRDFVFVVAYHLGLRALLGPLGYQAYFVCYVLGTGFILNLLGFNHVGTEAYTDCVLCNTRNIGSSPFIRAFTLYAGHHVEHHILPRVPWYRLPELARILDQEGGPRYSVEGFFHSHALVLKGHLAAAWQTFRPSSREGPRGPLP